MSAMVDGDEEEEEKGEEEKAEMEEEKEEKEEEKEETDDIEMNSDQRRNVDRYLFVCSLPLVGRIRHD